MDPNSIIECAGFYFVHNFDSGNLGHVERVPSELIAPSVNHKSGISETPHYEFNIWTRPDCAGTEFENGNRTWFYFGMQAPDPGKLVRLNLLNLNKQGKMYNQGMAPVTRTLPGKPHWERIKDRPIHTVLANAETDETSFTLSFKYKTSDNSKATTFFAFTYPYSFAELQLALQTIDAKMLPTPPPQSLDDIYYWRECLIYSLEGRRVDLLTISSHHGITTEREERLTNLFPEKDERPFKFHNKKVIFISARVHPGETPSSFVFNGLLNVLLSKTDIVAIQLRKLYVFKMIPFLNPDGVARGHYRTDTRGVNLNRVYLNPSLTYHPTVYASRSLIRYYHFGYEREDVICEDGSSIYTQSEVFEPPKKLNSPSRGKDLKANDPKKTSVRSMTPKLPAKSQTENTQKETTTLAIQTSKDTLSGSSCGDEKPVLSAVTSSSHPPPEFVHGSNLLRPLRDTLNNSISLLMTSASSADPGVAPLNAGEIRDARMSTMKMGWCEMCRMEYQARVASTCHSVCADAVSVAAPPQQHKSSEKDTVHFCTNCFRRYMAPASSGEEIELNLVRATASVDPSGDSAAALNPSPASAGRVPKVREKAKPAPEKPESREKGEKPEKPEKPEKLRKKPSPVQVAPSPPSLLQQPLRPSYREPESGLYLYIDLHGHASKKGIFMYGNHFPDADRSVECMLLPRIMSLNNVHFHFSSCNFTERNMYLKDRRDGMSREGSGRVAVLKATGLVRSYTLECNYNTGRLVNVLPPACADSPANNYPQASSPIPPKYTPHIYEEVGKSLGASILDLTNNHPNSRIPQSEHRNLSSVREWLKAQMRAMRPQMSSTMSRLRTKNSPTRLTGYARIDRKENTYVKEPEHRTPPHGNRTGQEIVNMATKFIKKDNIIKVPSRPKCTLDSDSKSKIMVTKRRTVLAMRKPNSVKPRLDTGLKPKCRRADDGSPINPKMPKRNFSRPIRVSRSKLLASTSSSDIVVPGGSWEEVGTVLGTQESLSNVGKRRQYPHPSPSALLKKIRLKTAL